MTEQPNGEENRTEPHRETLTGPPRWVKVSVVVAGILLLVVLVVMLLSGGEHGPARHGFRLDAPSSSPAAAQVQGSGRV
jgi:hypothetical protein